MSEIIGFLTEEEKKRIFSENGQPHSAPITIEDADALISRYVASSTIGGERVPVKLQTSDGKAVDGFYFKIDHIRTLLDKVPNIQGIYVASGEYDDSVGRTMILYGVKDDGRVHEVDYEIFDYSEPCPCKCPKDKNGHNCP